MNMIMIFHSDEWEYEYQYFDINCKKGNNLVRDETIAIGHCNINININMVSDPEMATELQIQLEC